MNYQIRNATLEDLDAITAVEATCFPPAEAADKNSFQLRITTFPESFFLAETMDGEIIGFINGCMTNETVLKDELYHNVSLHNPAGDYQTIFGLDVLPAYRRQGIAANLMNHLIEISKKRGKKGIILTCKDHLIHYYETFGYEHQGISNSTHGGAVWNDMTLLFY